MSELKAFNSERIYWAVEQVEREAGDIDELHLDDNLFYLKSEADKVIAEYQEKILVLEKSYKKLVKKFVHESSVAESYRSLIYKDDALKYKEEGNLEMYDELSKKSDKAYRHANRWRRIFRKLSHEEK